MGHEYSNPRGSLRFELVYHARTQKQEKKDRVFFLGLGEICGYLVLRVSKTAKIERGIC